MSTVRCEHHILSADRRSYRQCRLRVAADDAACALCGEPVCHVHADGEGRCPSCRAPREPLVRSRWAVPADLEPYLTDAE